MNPIALAGMKFQGRRGPRLALAICAALLLAVLPAGCADDDDPGLEIAGSYMDDFATSHVITDATWTMDFGTGFGAATFAILQFSNRDDFLVAQNGAENAFNAGLYSRFSWTTSAAELYFCQDPFDAASEAEAAATDTVDRTDPATGGCGGFPWSRLTAQ